jgi:hypothetical protein
MIRTTWKISAKPEAHVAADRNAYNKYLSGKGCSDTSRTAGMYYYRVGGGKPTVRLLAAWKNTEYFANDKKAMEVLYHEGTHQLLNYAMGDHIKIPI